MVDFTAITFRTADIIKIFKENQRDAEEDCKIDNDSAVAIQRIYRGVLDRNKIYWKGLAALEIERVFRGHVGRKHSRKESDNKYQYKQRARVNYFIIYIQRCFRGYYSRKYRQNYAMRKKYVEHIVNVASEVRNKMNLYATEQAEALSREAEEEANKEFRTLAENLHHLVGTKAIRGIYNPAPHLMAEPTAQAIPIEEHLRGVVKDLLRTTGRITHKGLIEDVNGTKKIPYKGLYNKLSIQASAPYDTVKRAEQNAKILHKISCVDPKNEYVTCRKPYRAPEKSNNEGDPFLDKWANPFFVKGVPKNEQQLKESIRQRKALFALPTDPYHNWHAGTSGNKSAAYPNDIFDIMGDATMTGGTAHRHMGRTDRFGLASSSDNRGMRGSTLPNPPLRDTKVLYGDNGIYLRNTSTTSISKHTITVSGGNTSRNKSSISDRSGSPSLKQSSKVRTIKNDVVKVRGLLPVSPKANVVKNTGFDAHDPYVSSDEEVGE